MIGGDVSTIKGGGTKLHLLVEMRRRDWKECEEEEG